MPEHFRDRLNGKPEPNAERGFCIERDVCLESEEICVYVIEGKPFATYTNMDKKCYKATISQDAFDRMWTALRPDQLPRECLMLTDLDFADGESYMVRTVDARQSSRLIVSGQPDAYVETEANAIARSVVTAFQEAKDLAFPSSWWRSPLRSLRREKGGRSF